jgi:hypothetical protein
MGEEALLIMIAGVSLYERCIVESVLKNTGFTAVAVQDAEDAERELAACGASGVLVIDSGLLEAAHDPQWRQLRIRHPGLGTAVRCLVPQAKGIQRQSQGTFLVDPDDDEGLREAVGVLAVMAADSPAAPASSRRDA